MRPGPAVDLVAAVDQAQRAIGRHIIDAGDLLKCHRRQRLALRQPERVDPLAGQGGNGRVAAQDRIDGLIGAHRDLAIIASRSRPVRRAREKRRIDSLRVDSAAWRR